MLTVCCGRSRLFEPDEITLIEQVANQCAIALRQSELHSQKHDFRVSADYFRSFLETSTDVFVEYDCSFALSVRESCGLHHARVGCQRRSLAKRIENYLATRLNATRLHYSACL